MLDYDLESAACLVRMYVCVAITSWLIWLYVHATVFLPQMSNFALSMQVAAASDLQTLLLPHEKQPEPSACLVRTYVLCYCHFLVDLAVVAYVHATVFLPRMSDFALSGELVCKKLLFLAFYKQKAVGTPEVCFAHQWAHYKGAWKHQASST